MKFWEPIARRSSSVSCRSLTPDYEVMHAKETVRQSGLRLCIMPGLSTHLVQELNFGNVPRVLARI